MNKGNCFTNSKDSLYNIPTDSDGNNVLTGDGKAQLCDEKYYTCVELEVFSISN